jgi:Ca-activated chloride channel family protein
MEFARPEYFWLLLAIPLVGVLWGIGVWHQRRMRARFGNIGNLQSISRISWVGGSWVRGLLFLASLVLMTVGLAYPRMVIRELRAVPTPTDLIFMLDISPSMYGRDMDPSRLGRAEQIVQRFILMKQPQDRYGLIVFNWNSVVLSYLTSDPQSVLLYFDYLNAQNEPETGTNMGSAITNALRVLARDEALNPELAKGRRPVFVMLSDGDDTANQLQKPLMDDIKANVKIYSFGLGTANGAYVPLVTTGGLQGQVLKYLTHQGGARIISHAEMRTMREISEKTGGRFFRGEDNKQLNQALEEILLSGRPVAGFQSNAVRKDLYFYFLIAAFACMVGGVFL